MIASTVLQEAVSKFLTNVARYTGIPFCLLDSDRTEIVKTPVEDRSEPFLNEIAQETERAIVLRDGSKWYLYSLDQPLPGTELLREQVLDFTTEVIVFIIKNEEEMQNLSTELLERYQELHVLYDVINDVSSVLDEDSICMAVLQKAMQTLDVGYGAVAFIDDAISAMVKRCSIGDTGGLSDTEILGYAEYVCTANTHIIVEEKNAETSESSGGKPGLLAVPVAADNVSMGAVLVASKHHEGRFTTGDRVSLTALAGYLGIAIKSSLLIKEAREAEALRHEFDFARKIQESLLPKRLPAFSTLDIAARCHPAAEVGGDLYSCFECGRNEWIFGVADVSGHGLGSAFILASLRSILRSESRRFTNLECLIGETNNTLCEDTEDSELFATLIMASYSDVTRTLHSVNAGHPPGILWRAQTSELVQLESGGMAVGMFRDESYGSNDVTLEPGDVLLLYTDGIMETKNPAGEYYGIDRLRVFLSHAASMSAEAILVALIEDATLFRGSAKQNDDITIVIAKAR